MSTRSTLHAQVFANEYRIENLRGKEYLVVPAVPVREQVMNNYLVPSEEIEEAELWNGTSICIRHPELNSGSVNVPDPDVAVIGKFFNGTWDSDGNRVVGEYWIDMNEAMQYAEGQYVINAIYNNQVLETSTGYYAAKENSSGEFNGRRYDSIHRNLKPDHIAILVDAIGACSVADGCGVNRNSLLHDLYTNAMELNGGPGSGFWGHLGRQGQVGGSSGTGTKPRLKPKTTKKLKKGIKAYYVAGKSEAGKRSTGGFKTKVSLMSKSKAGSLYDKMTRGGGEEPAILEVNLKAGTEYETLTSTSITLSSIPGDNISIITYETLQKRKQEPFINSADCNCNDAKAYMLNEESITQKIDTIRKAFYDNMAGETPYSAYINEYFEGYLVVEANGSLWKCTYAKEGDSYTFQDVADWTKMIINPEKYIEQNMVYINITGNLPARAKKLWEKVYQDWLSEHPKDTAGASKRAWGAIKQAGWKKEGDSWVKSNSVVKGVDIRGTRKHNRNSNWLITNESKQQEKKTMKQKLGDILKKLRGEGLVINASDIDEEQILEFSDEGEEEDDEEETREEKLSPRTQNAVKQLSDTELAMVRNLSKVDWNSISKLAEQAPALLEVTQNAVRERDAQKKTLIANIKASEDNTFTDEELDSFTIPVLNKLAGKAAMDYSALGSVPLFTNQALDDDDTLAVPEVVLNQEEEV